MGGCPGHWRMFNSIISLASAHWKSIALTPSFSQKMSADRKFPGNPVVRTLCSPCQGCQFNPDWETKSPWPKKTSLQTVSNVPWRVKLPPQLRTSDLHNLGWVWMPQIPQFRALSKDHRAGRPTYKGMECLPTTEQVPSCTDWGGNWLCVWATSDSLGDLAVTL